MAFFGRSLIVNSASLLLLLACYCSYASDVFVVTTYQYIVKLCFYIDSQDKSLFLFEVRSRVHVHILANSNSLSRSTILGELCRIASPHNFEPFFADDRSDSPSCASQGQLLAESPVTLIYSNLVSVFKSIQTRRPQVIIIGIAILINQLVTGTRTRVVSYNLAARTFF